jgi:dihydroorotate dehydrogenase electron transfer subunit
MSGDGGGRYRLQAPIEAISCRHGICSLTMTAPAICRTARAGQFIMVRAAEPQSKDPLLRRPFSIHRIAGDRLTIVFKVVGRGTEYLAQLRSQEELDVIGPMGRGFMPVEAAPLHYLVGGGLGIAPLHLLAESIRRDRPAAPVIALLGARNAAELEAFADIRTVQGLEVRVSTDDGSVGQHGFVTDLLARAVPELGPGAVYCCGPLPMMQAVARYCRERELACQVSLEAMMACAVGACLGCAVPKAAGAGDDGYVHVCKDGPVFAAEEIWR